VTRNSNTKEIKRSITPNKLNSQDTS